MNTLSWITKNAKKLSLVLACVLLITSMSGCTTKGTSSEAYSEAVKKLPMLKLLSHNGEDGTRQAEAMKQMLKQNLGIDIELEPLAFADSLDRQDNGQYQMAVAGWGPDYNDPMTFMDLWITNSGFSKFFGGYHSKQYDSIFKKLDGEQNIEKRGQVYSELETQLVVTDAGIAPYMYLDSRYFVQNYVKNISLPSFGPSIEFSRAYIQGK
jgi:oligopeptide transport system substrate-binding protein